MLINVQKIYCIYNRKVLTKELLFVYNANIQKDVNSKIINGSYQDQELSGHIFSNGKIKVNKGEGGSVPWKKIYELFSTRNYEKIDIIVNVLKR